MPDQLTLLAVYALPLLAAWLLYAALRRREHERALARWRASEEAGLTDPASLHPLIDPALCLGCGSCVDACPEGRILGLVRGKAQLVDPTMCIGHGACQEACPQDAITLVLGTETRGVEIPHVGPDFQTNVPGLYVAGELGGMGLIRNAIEQGRQAVDAIAGGGARAGASARTHATLEPPLDLVIVGAGPAGIAASLRAQELGLRFVTIDQDTLGGTVAHFPRGKIVMTAPVDLPLYGEVALRETTKEALLELWTSVVRKTKLTIRFEERLIGIGSEGALKHVRTSRGEYRSASVLLAIGRRGTPRQLGVPGEELDKVVYRLADPTQYSGARVLVVGGGDSALEAAIALADEDVDVTLSYRSEAFSRAKAKNREKIEEKVRAGRIQLMLPSQVLRIDEGSVAIETPLGSKEIANDAVIVCAGGLLPTPLLRDAGIEIETKHGEA